MSDSALTFSGTEPRSDRFEIFIQRSKEVDVKEISDCASRRFGSALWWGYSAQSRIYRQLIRSIGVYGDRAGVLR